MKSTKKIAFCGILAALEIVILILSGIFSFSEYSIPAIAGLISVICVIEIDKKHSYILFLVTSVLSLFLSPNKEAVFYYIIFFGYYPILKASLEKFSKKSLQWVAKLIVFNIADILFFLTMFLIFSIPKESLMIGNIYIPGIFYVGLLIVFILYDLGLTSVITLYINRYHKYLKKFLK